MHHAARILRRVSRVGRPRALPGLRAQLAARPRAHARQRGADERADDGLCHLHAGLPRPGPELLSRLRLQLRRLRHAALPPAADHHLHAHQSRATTRGFIAPSSSRRSARITCAPPMRKASPTPACSPCTSSRTASSPSSPWWSRICRGSILGSLLIENLFGIPGLGNVLVQAHPDRRPTGGHDQRFPRLAALPDRPSSSPISATRWPIRASACAEPDPGFLRPLARRMLLVVVGFALVFLLLRAGARNERWQRAWVRLKRDRTGLIALVVVAALSHASARSRCFQVPARAAAPAASSISSPPAWPPRKATARRSPIMPLDSAQHEKLARPAPARHRCARQGCLRADAQGLPHRAHHRRTDQRDLRPARRAARHARRLFPRAGWMTSSNTSTARSPRSRRSCCSSPSSSCSAKASARCPSRSASPAGSASAASSAARRCGRPSGPTSPPRARSGRRIGRSSSAICCPMSCTSCSSAPCSAFPISCSPRRSSATSASAPRSARASWGVMIDAGRSELGRDPLVWWNITAATGALFGLVLSLNLLGDALRRAFDPKRT